MSLDDPGGEKNAGAEPIAATQEFRKDVMSSAAHQDTTLDPFALQATGTEDRSLSLKLAAAERLAAHRERRDARAGTGAGRSEKRHEGSPRPVSRNGAARVREAVASRYSSVPSYRDILAAEAERALRAAQAEAEAAARNLRAASEAQMELLAKLEQHWEDREPGPQEAASTDARDRARGALAHALTDIALGACELMEEADAQARSGAQAAVQQPVAATENLRSKEVSSGGLTVRFSDIFAAASEPCGEPWVEPGPETAHESEPGLDLPPVETTPIPANLIEFPRQLIAPRRARPRLAEGPLREGASREAQLRIFEVAADTIETAPAPEAAPAPGWQSLLLESQAPAFVALSAEPSTHLALPPHVAALSRRLMAALVDGCCIAAAFAGFAALAARLAGPSLGELPRPTLGAVSGGVLLAFFVLYQMFFFSLSDRTPGMRYARLALCTFGDDNPSRRAMRRRVLATLLAASPLGLGLIWSFLDSERLGWHDRMSRMYQRAY